MAQSWAKGFYKSSEWKSCRAGYIRERIRIDGGMCEVCHVKLGYIVHHKIILTQQNVEDPEISLNWKFLSFECKDCHDQHEGHGIKRTVSPVCVFDSDGNPVQILPKYEQNRL